MRTVLQTIASQLVSRTAFSPAALDQASASVIDTLGCMFAGAKDKSAMSVRKAFAPEILGLGPAGLIGGGAASISLAALINGTAAHALDFDDNFHPARAHASAVLVPSLLAAAAMQTPVSGMRFLKAYLAGLEAQAAIGFGVNPSHYNQGWHATATVGCIGAAAGVAHLLGADEEATAQAMSLATSLACGLKGQFGTSVKPIHAGIAARNAVEAARLAMAGAEGRLDILERPQGFLDLYGGPDAAGWANLTFGEKHIIETRGLVTKRHPCCASTHRAIDALLDLQRMHGFSADDIATIETKVGISAARNLAYSDPQDEMQARFSMQYCLAVALAKGSLSLSDFTPPPIARPAIRALMPRIMMTAYSAEEEMGVERLPHIVAVTLRNGAVHTMSRLYAQGAIEAPLVEDERQTKFEDCMRWAGRHDGDEVYRRLGALLDAEDIVGTVFG